MKNSAIGVAAFFGVLVVWGALSGGYSFGEAAEAFFAIIGAFALLEFIYEKVSVLIKSKMKAKQGRI